MNRILIDGHLGKDPEEFRALSPSRGDNAVCKFSVSSSYKPRDKEAETTWFNVVCFGHVAEGALSLKKGDRVFIEGRFESKKYKKKDGTEGQSWQVVANNVYLSVGKKKGDASHVSTVLQNTTKTSITDDEIPF